MVKCQNFCNISLAQSAHLSTTGEGIRITVKGPGINVFRQDTYLASAAGFWDTIFTWGRDSGISLTGLRTNHDLHSFSLPVMQWWRRPASMILFNNLWFGVEFGLDTEELIGMLGFPRNSQKFGWWKSAIPLSQRKPPYWNMHFWY